ncbi:MAG: HAD family hydrolase [Ruminococcaceae bacterium]|nr:HAD family hydrolase [Oscillospiraceae bacterium]
MTTSCILFDLDGTLTDPGIGITNSVMYALKKFGIEETDRKSLYRFIGPPLSESFERFYGFSTLSAMLAVDYYREYYTDRGIFENKLYDGMKELLKELHSRGKQIVLATSKPEIFANKILKHFEIEEYFLFVSGSFLDGRRTDKAEVIAHALKECNNPSAIMVGDRKHDVIGARKCGLDCVGVLFGYGSHAELEEAGAKWIVDDVSELSDLLIKNNG